jgi:X-X-X-Leu-X-X-Gly heptad repeat protein
MFVDGRGGVARRFGGEVAPRGATMFCCSLRVAILAGLLLGVVRSAPTPSTSSRLDEDESRTFLRGWLLFDDPTSDGVRRKGPTAKSVFIAPVVKDLPDCAQGYYADALGRCHKIVQINQTAQLGFLLQKLNAMYANNDKLIKRPSATTEGPLQVSIPLASLQEKPSTTTTTTTVAEEEVKTTTETPVTEEVDMMVVAAEVQIKDDRQSISLPGAIVTLWHFNTTSTTDIPQSTTPTPDTTSTEQEGQSTTIVIVEDQTEEDTMTSTEEGTTTQVTDGTTTQDQNGTTDDQDGTTQDQHGTTQYQDGTTQYQDGTTQYQQDGTTQYQSGTTQVQDGTTTVLSDEGTTQSQEDISETDITTSSVTETTPMPSEETTPSSPTDYPSTQITSTPVPGSIISVQNPKSDSDIRVIDSDLSSANSAEQPLTYELPLSNSEQPSTWHDQPLRWPPKEDNRDQSEWSWGPWQRPTSTPRPPLYLNFWSSQPHVPDPTIRTRTGLRRPPSRYPATFNGRPAPIYYQELTGQDVATVFRQQDTWYRGHRH